MKKLVKIDNLILELILLSKMHLSFQNIKHSTNKKTKHLPPQKKKNQKQTTTGYVI